MISADLRKQQIRRASEVLLRNVRSNYAEAGCKRNYLMAANVAIIHYELEFIQCVTEAHRFAAHEVATFLDRPRPQTRVHSRCPPALSEVMAYAFMSLD